MPEGDTIHRTAATLRRAVVGRALVRVELPRVAPPLPRVGARIDRVEARGKHLLVHVSDGLVVHTHQRMSGAWHVYAPGQPWRKHRRAARVVLGTDTAVAVCFASPVVEVLDAPAIARHPALRALGPDLCDPSVDLAEVAGRFDRGVDPGRAIGEALLDQRVACGIGNVYRCDVLFLHGIDPWIRVGDVDRPTRAALLRTASQLLQANLSTARRSTLSASEDAGTWVHGREGQPCRRCATPIAVGRLGDQARYVYWCPTCQARTTSPSD
jgi:endonuclease VIII